MEIDNDNFWLIIENAWDNAPKLKAKRMEIIGTQDITLIEQINEVLNKVVIPNLQKELKKFSKKELISFDRILEKYIYNLDKEDLCDQIMQGDDGFLYSRGFIVAMGKRYYQIINNDSSKAISSLLYPIKAEEMCFISWYTYFEKYDEYISESGISRETGSNAKGWLKE